MATTTPSSWDYMKKPETVQTVMQMTKPRASSLKWVKPPPPKKKPAKTDPEVVLGPGLYNPFGEPAPKDYKKVKSGVLTEKRTTSAFFPKSTAPNAIVAASKSAKYNACVGMYDTRKEDERRRDKANVKPATAPFLVKEKRIDDQKKPKKDKGTPGPGAYEVLPPMENDVLTKKK